MTTLSSLAVPVVVMAAASNEASEWLSVNNWKKIPITLPPVQNGWHFADNIFKYILFNEKVSISFDISSNFVLVVPTDIRAALVQVMAWLGATETANQTSRFFFFYHVLENANIWKLSKWQSLDTPRPGIHAKYWWQLCNIFSTHSILTIVLHSFFFSKTEGPQAKLLHWQAIHLAKHSRITRHKTC